MDPSDRIAMLESFIESSPDDPFPRYSLALECINNVGDYDRAATVFARLVSEKPEYVATYLMYGTLLASHLGDATRAREIFKLGVTAAQKAGDGHAASELSAALADLPESS